MGGAPDEERRLIAGSNAKAMDGMQVYIKWFLKEGRDKVVARSTKVKLCLLRAGGIFWLAESGYLTRSGD